MESVETSDLYHASYLLLSGCQLTGAECSQVGKNLSCRLSFQGQSMSNLNDNWYQKRAMVNLWAFRQAHAQVHQYVDMAKKEFIRDGGNLR